ncbi:MAG: chorismate synthase, partial [Desulfobulbaceae bacterium]|nr:chorismate synthase [Desulfobulbaceae bacterium]
VAFKPTATIGREQQTVDENGKPSALAAKGRHDPCVVPRATPIVEAMTALVLLDLALCQEARQVFVRKWEQP